MCNKVSYLICLALGLAVAGTGAVLGDTWEARTADAAEDQLTRGMYLTSSDLELPYDGGLQVIGMRFAPVGVPKGASILQAYIEFTVDELEANQAANLIIDGELKANPAPLGSTRNDISSRARTKAQVSWHPEHFTTVGAKHKTVDLGPVIEEIVNQADWANGGPLVLMIRDDPSNPSKGSRTVGTKGQGNSSPLLHIEWSPEHRQRLGTGRQRRALDGPDGDVAQRHGGVGRLDPV
jgi:hypothetical protein